MKQPRSSRTRFGRSLSDEGEYLAEYQLYILSPDDACRVPFSSVQSSMYKIAPGLNQLQYQKELVLAMKKFRAEWYLEPEVVSNDDILDAYALKRRSITQSEGASLKAR